MKRLDPKRLATLERLQVMKRTMDPRYDEIVASLATRLSVPICLVNVLDGQRDWIKASFGINRTETSVETSFCEAFFETNVDFVIAEDTTGDPRFWKNPYVLGSPYVRFYAAARLAISGDTIGTLCAFDFAPRTLENEQVEALKAAARQIVELIAEIDRRVP